VHQPHPGLAQHRLGQAGDPADHVQAHDQLPAKPAQRLGQLGELGGVVADPPVQHDLAAVVDRGRPVDLLGDVDACPDAHPRLPAPWLPVPLPSLAGTALRSDGSQSLITSPGNSRG
jgi:hypothetical protein